jgi:hypothetical protein
MTAASVAENERAQSRHGWDLERIADAIVLFRKRPSRDSFEIGFYVFDVVMDQGFENRLERA